MAAKFTEFRRLQKERGVDDAVRALALEQHTVSEMAKLLKGNNKEDFVDLTHGGRLTAVCIIS